jgi:hypothetical protein
MKFRYVFIPAGSSIVKEGNSLTLKNNFDSNRHSWPYGSTFVVDVGNSLEHGIIDHHQPGTERECSASLIAKYPQRFILNHLDQSDEYILITHRSPDFDALASLYFTQKIISHGSLPCHADIFAQYVLDVDSGKQKLYPDKIVTPFSLLLAISQISYNNFQHNKKDNDVRILTKSFRLFDAIFINLSNGIGIDQMQWNDIEWLNQEIQLLFRDNKIYQEDFEKRSKANDLNVIDTSYECSLKKIPCITTWFPKSLLWKYWARSDTIHAETSMGFLGTIAILPSNNTRIIIAVVPDSGCSLKGLGLYLDYLEMKKLLNRNDIFKIIGNKRLGFHRENPWYDGRSSLHNYTIVDAPINGSVLAEQIILKAIENIEIWGNAFKNKSFDRLSASDIIRYFEKLQ